MATVRQGRSSSAAALPPLPPVNPLDEAKASFSNPTGLVAPWPAPPSAPAPAAPAAPSPVTPPPTAPPPATVETTLQGQLAAGKKYAEDNGIGAVGSMGRMSDPRQAEMSALLAKLQLGQNGLTPEEMQAAREQGRTEIDRQLAGNMRRLGNTAAANGVRGSSAAGLQARATSDAQSASGDLGRKLILDNIAQRNLGTQRYTDALTGQQNTELGIQGKNIGFANSETMLRQSMPWAYSGALDAAHATADSKKYGEDSLDIARKALEGTQTAAADEKKKEADATTLKDKTYTSASGGSYPVQTDPDGTKFYTSPTGLKIHLTKNADGNYAPIEGKSENPLKKNPAFAGYENALADVTTGAGVNAAQREGETQRGCAPGVYCYVATAAVEAGLIERAVYDAAVRICPLSRAERKEYKVWGPSFAKFMQSSALVSRICAYLLPDTFKAIQGKKTSWKGYIGYYGVYLPGNFLSRLYLKVTNG